MPRPKLSRHARRTGPVAELVERRMYLSASATASAAAGGGAAVSMPIVVLKSGMTTPEGYTSPNGAPITPALMRDAYGLGTVGSSSVTFGGVQGDGSGQTIAIIAGGNDPTIASDLASFDSYWGLPAPPSFTVESASGGTTLPATGDVDETSLDVQWSHVMAPGASIILLEGNIYTGVTTALSTAGVAVISISYNISGTQSDSFFETPTGHTGVTVLAASGDSAGDVNEPGRTATVVSVGGTDLTMSGTSYGSETAWDDGGGGIATGEAQPAYQAVKAAPFSTTYRTTPDVAMDADPGTGVAVYDTTDNTTAAPWTAIVGGTSLATPLMAGVVAVADQGRVAAGLTAMDGYTQTLPRLYTLPSNAFHDITTGSNAYPALPGYDLATGLGSVNGTNLIPDLAGADTITGTAFVDANADGTYDAGDTLLANKVVYLDVGNTGAQASTDPTATTNASGVYTFADVIGGESGTVRLASPPTGDPYLSTVTSFATSYDAKQTVNLGFAATAIGPTVATAAAASPSTVTGTTTALSVLGADATTGASTLTYTWAATTTPANTVAPTFSANGTNAAKSTTATFYKAGTYVFTVTITDTAGRTINSSVTVVVSQTLTSLVLTPADPNLTSGQTQQLSAVQHDQFGNVMTSSATVTWTLVSGGGTVTTAGLYTTPATGTLAVVKATAGSITASLNVYVVTSPWTSVDVGSPALAGSAYDTGAAYPSDTFTVAGAGADVYGTTDQFHYVYQSLTGDGTIIARVASQQNTATAAKAGVMIRSALASGSELAAMDLTAGKGPEFLYRTTTGGDTLAVAGTASIKAPYYVKLVRVGSLFTGYVSSNGTTWTEVSSATITMTGTIYIGLFDGSVNSAALSTDTFDHVVIGPTLATAAAASPNPVTGTTTALSALGADTNGASTLTYTWSATTIPAGATAPTFPVNGTNAAAATTATFHLAGAYVFTVTITDAEGSTVTSAVSVTVSQTLTTVAVSPATSTVASGSTAQFTATAKDQFGTALATQPTITWSVDNGGVGTVSSTGLYTAPASGTGTATVRATTGSISGTATVTEPLSVVAGTTGNDVIRLVRSGANLLVYVNNATAPLYTVAYASVGALAVNTNTGTDTVTVDFSGGATPVPTGGLTVTGGSSTAGDSLVVLGTTGADTIAVAAATATVNGSTVVYANMGSVVVDGDGGADTLTQTAQPGNSASLTFNGITTGGPSSADTLNVNAGTFAFAAPTAGDATQLLSLGTLSVATGATVTVATATATTDRWVFATSAVTLAGTGKLDLGGNDMIVHNGSATALAGLLKAGYAAGTWTGAGGIDSAAAAANTAKLTALGYTLNDVNGTALYTTFDGQPVTTTDVLVKYTDYGDANLDGVVNAADYTRVDVGFVLGLTGWVNGDFNYDGTVDGSDYTLMDNAFNQQSVTAAVVAATASPAASVAVAAKAAPTVAASPAAAARPAASHAWTFATAAPIVPSDPNNWFTSDDVLTDWRRDAKPHGVDLAPLD
jgi:subtilase family serine protease